MSGDFRVKNGILVGTESVDASSLLTLNSTTKGALFPRMTETQRDAVSSPATGLVIYNTTANKLNVYDGSSWTDVGSGGAGGINYVTNYDFESNITGYSAYADAAATTPVDGTGGSPSYISVTHDLSNGNAPRGAGSLKIAHAGGGSAQGEGGAYDVTIHDMDAGKALTFAFDYWATSGYASDEVECFVIADPDGTPQVITVNATEDFDGKLKATGAGTSPEDARQYIGQFYAVTGVTSYRIVWHVRGTATTAWDMYVDNVRVGPESFYNMPIVQYLGEYTPTVTHDSGTATNYTISAKQWRVDNILKVKGRVDFTGAVGTWSGFYIAMPSGLTVDTAGAVKLATSKCGFSDTGTTWYDGAARYFSSTNKFALHTWGAGATYVNGGGITQAVPHAWASTDYIDFEFEVPVLEWANSSTTMSTTQYNAQTVKAIYEANGSSANTSFADAADEFIDYNNAIEDTHNAVTTGASWKFTAPVSGTYSVNCNLAWGSTTNLARTLMFLWKNGSIHRRLQDITGVATTIVGAVDVELEAGDYIQVSGYQDDSTSAARSIQTSTGLSSISVKRVPDFTTIGVYSPYEVLESNSDLAAYAITVNTWGDLTSLPLKPGTWEIHVKAHFYNSAAVTAATADIGISVDSGTSFSDAVWGDNIDAVSNPGTSQWQQGISLSVFDVVVTGTTTYYLKARHRAAITNLQVAYKMTAVRKK